MTAGTMALIREYTQHIDAAPAAVFPLLCPVREGEWLDGWAEGCEMVHSRSGVAEPGCVFRTHHPDRPVTTWVITAHDPEAAVVEFARVTPELDATTLRIVVSENASGASDVHVRYAVVPLSADAAPQVVDRWAPARFEQDMRWWERSMNHYLSTGRLLRGGDE